MLDRDCEIEAGKIKNRRNSARNRKIFWDGNMKGYMNVNRVTAAEIYFNEHVKVSSGQS